MIGFIFYAFPATLMVFLNCRSAFSEIEPHCCFCSLVTSGKVPDFHPVLRGSELSIKPTDKPTFSSPAFTPC